MAKSSAPKTTAELLELLSKSGLVNGEQQQAAGHVVAHAEMKDAARQLVHENLLTSWQAGQLLAGQFVLKLGDYALQSEVGPWEFGRAFVAQQLRSGQTVLLLLLANRFVQDESAWKATVNEIQMAGRLDGKHLSPFREVGRAAQRTFLIGPLLEQDVRQLLTRYGAPSADHVARIMEEVARGLATLHAAGLAHGCLRPHRLGLDQAGTVYLRELGLAPLARLLHPAAAPDLEAAELDRFAPPENTPPVRGDLYTLGRIGHFLLESPSGQARDAAESPPAWWAWGSAHRRGHRAAARAAPPAGRAGRIDGSARRGRSG